MTRINDALVQKIKLIDTIAGEFGDNREVLQGFQAITDSIQAIMLMLNNPDSFPRPNATARTTTMETPLYDKFIKLSEDNQDAILNEISDVRPDLYRTLIENLKNKTLIDRQNVQTILKDFYKGDLLRGGRMRRRTMKKLGKNMKKSRKVYKGGYVYSSSKELDKASSIITADSSKTKSSSSTSKSTTSKSTTSKSITNKPTTYKKRFTRKHKLRK